MVSVRTTTVMSGGHIRQWVETRGSTWQYWGSRLLPVTELTPLRIALAYTVFGLLALFVSDVLFVRYFSEPLLSQIQAFKGGVEVLLTAGLIFVLTNRRESQLQRTMTRLDHQREELQVLHRVLRHNLRNDLNVIQGYADLIHEQLPSDKLTPQCAMILDTVDKMTRYTEQATRIKRITDNNGRVQTYDLTETIPQLLDEPQVSSDIEVSMTLPDRVVIEANSMFEEALRELLTNAIEHNDAETPTITINVNPRSGPLHMVEIRIGDNGPGIPRSELEPLRERKEEQLLHLSGMGLWFVKWTVRHSDGELLFEDGEQGGTTVVIRVPKAPEMLSSTLWS